MSHRSYRKLPLPVSNRIRCPVCHEAVYSRADIHPQGAVHQSEAPQLKKRPQGVHVDLHPCLAVLEQACVEAVVDQPTADCSSVINRFPV
jgi:hypothetical protein